MPGVQVFEGDGVKPAPTLPPDQQRRYDAVMREAAFQECVKLAKEEIKFRANGHLDPEAMREAMEGLDYQDVSHIRDKLKANEKAVSAALSNLRPDMVHITAETIIGHAARHHGYSPLPDRFYPCFERAKIPEPSWGFWLGIATVGIAAGVLGGALAVHGHWYGYPFVVVGITGTALGLLRAIDSWFDP
jgi:hypothetical protein